MTTIYLIRHSVKFKSKDINYIYVDDNKNLKDEKTILSVIGEKRSEILCNKSIFDNIDSIYASSMVRSIATAKYLSNRLNLPINIDSRLNERRYGKQNSSHYKDWYQRQYTNPSFKTEGGESQLDVRNRMLDALEDILNNNKDKNVCVFSHGYAITFLLLNYCKLVNVNEERVLTFEYKNKIVYDKVLNAPEVFKLIFNDKELISIENICFDDLEHMEAGV